MDRIYFADNPWTNGHRIVEFSWEAHFEYEDVEEEEKGLYFDLHIKTADYYEEDEEVEEEEEESDWDSKAVWGNYHSCTLSSQYWENRGFLVGNNQEKFDAERFTEKEYKVDFLTEEEQEELDVELLAFHVYLLGHDAAAFHTIKFSKVDGRNYQIDWAGKLALAYIGESEFKHTFQTVISQAKFNGITIPDELTNSQAFELLERFVKQPMSWELKLEGNERKFVLK